MIPPLAKNRSPNQPRPARALVSSVAEFSTAPAGVSYSSVRRMLPLPQTSTFPCVCCRLAVVPASALALPATTPNCARVPSNSDSWYFSCGVITLTRPPTAFDP